MKTKLERTEEALELAQAFICIMRKSGLLSPGRREELALEYGARIDAILSPAPEMEEVLESAGWVNIYPAKPSSLVKSELSHAYPSRELADSNANGARIDCQELFVKVQRPKPQPVEKIVSGQFQLNGTFRCDGVPVTDHYGKCVTVTWLEPPK